MTESKTKLFIKQSCPWCIKTIRFLRNDDIDVDLRDVYQSPRLQRLIEISGQNLTPTLEFGDFLISDFSVSEHNRALEERPYVRQSLEIGLNFSRTSRQ